MKRWIFCLLFAFMGLSMLSGLELTVWGGLGNLAFDPKNEQTLGSMADDQTFSPTFYFPVDVCLKGDVSSQLSFSVRANRDIILRNRLITSLGFDNSYLGIKFGPVIGLLNSKSKIIKPGISAELSLRLPGIIFATVRADSSLGASFIEDGDYSQESSYFGLGFWVPNVVITLSMALDNYTESIAAGLLAKDDRTRYQLSAVAHRKNSPYIVDVNFGYQVLKRAYIRGGAVEQDELRNIYGGFDFRMDVTKFFRFMIGGEMSIYSWAEDPLIKPPLKELLYEAHLGLGFTFPSKR